jgi:hypothetical protein
MIGNVKNDSKQSDMNLAKIKKNSSNLMSKNEMNKMEQESLTSNSNNSENRFRKQKNVRIKKHFDKNFE